MPARIIDGRALAARVRQEVADGAAALAARGVVPGLAVILVGDDPGSQIYVRSKERAAEKVGVRTFDHRLPATIAQAELLALIHTLNADDAVHGILLQLPLPKHLDPAAAQDAISPAKDVDGLHPHNLGLLAQGRPRFVPCTPNGCMRMLAELDCDPAGKRAVVIGRSNLVGRPMLLLLANANATVIGCHSRTRDLAAEVRRAEIVVAAVGVANLVKGDWVAPGAVVLDVGMNRLADGSLCGDVDFAAVSQHAAAITPVPGGVGPMTIAGLLENTLAAARARL
ncbi:MAG TPA: bifunctional methylenetetrahydrofolate dehydrogenase/methenyltetrahydrofolate cyclohydrolase FolD [Kofleriaceae bacterium]|nr:bifunctional methylenetetrahydrofolate dehydrogenase/methenyltetrahydrofolate cyclohydrolase FolD [Kofleriaceae bacterium]